jgi:hypothetical protein
LTALADASTFWNRIDYLSQLFYLAHLPMT